MISCHNSGTHSIQCLMEIINTKEEEEIIKVSIKNDILTLSYVMHMIKSKQDPNGTHVMQKIIAIIDEKDREYINVTVLNNLLDLVYDANGICVVRKECKIFRSRSSLMAIRTQPQETRYQAKFRKIVLKLSRTLLEIILFSIFWKSGVMIFVKMSQT